jgi:hypothetical protein
MGLVIPEIHPDIVVFYEGWNDIRNYHDPKPSPEYYSHGMRQYLTLQLAPPEQPTVLARLADMSAIVRLALVGGKAVTPATARADTTKSQLPVFATPDTFVDRIYKRNLATLKFLSERSGAYTIFVPQVLNDAWYRQHTGGDWWTPRIDNQAMPALIERFGQMMREICDAARDAQCAIIDDVRSLKWQADDFIDEGHFSGKGGESFARVLAPRIAQIAASRHRSAATAR